MERRRLLKATAVIAAATAMAFTSISASSADDDVFRVVVLGGLSAKGILADNASTSVLAARAGVDVINKRGGIGGKNVEIQVLDDQANPTVAITKLREALSSGGKPNLVLNSGPSSVSNATLPILNQAGILSFNIGPTQNSGDPKTFPLNFDLSPSPANYMAGFVEDFKNKGYERVGIIHGNSAYGEAFGTLAERMMTDAGIEVTAREGFDYSALDMTPQLDTIMATSPDALVVDAYGSVAGYVLQGVERLGWDIPLVGNTSIAATGLISKEPPEGVLGTDQVKNLVMQVFRSTKADPNATGVVEAVETMRSLGDIKASLILGYNFDAIMLAAAAAEAAGSIDGAAMAKALEQDAVTEAAATVIIPKYNFTPDNHSANPTTDAMTFIPPSPLKDGQYQ